MKNNIMKEKYPNLSLFLVIFIFLFLLSCILGKFGPTYIQNNVCYRYLGCNNGFFGYDIIEHFLSGITEVIFIAWLVNKYPALNFFYSTFWKNFLITAAVLALIATCWELGEFAHDEFRIKVFHENLFTPNHLDQPSNADTMGDMTFSILGGIITVGVINTLDNTVF